MTAKQAIRISEICDRFEWDWRKGAQPLIEKVVSDALPEDRPQLLEDLVRIEFELREMAGENPDAAEYQDRFPAEAELIGRVLCDVANAQVEEKRQFVGRYELLEEIGRGRQGVVYRAHEPGIAPLEVAVKLLGAGAVSSRADAQRFVKGVRAMARIDHENVVPYLGSGDDRGQLYCVMRYIRGSSLAGFLKERHQALEPVAATRIMIPIAEAVGYLHTQQPAIVHRDLNPHNILLDDNGKPFVADFGLVILLEGDRDDAEAGACGTFPYIAPEQFDGRFGEVGPASDIYSLGVILYELITGRPPFPRTRAAIVSTLETEPLPPGRRRAGIPDGLQRICIKCLRKSTRDRYASAAELVEELKCFVRDEPLTRTPAHNTWQRIRDWAKSEPALAARLTVIVACSAIIWGYRVITGRYAPLAPDHWAARLAESGGGAGQRSVVAILVWLNQAVLAAWGLASWALQRQLNLSRDSAALQLLWRVVDVVALCLLIELDDALMSPLTVAFAVLIVASTFRSRADQIVHTTVLSMAGYIVLALSYRLNHPNLDRAYRHFHYLVGLVLLALMLTHQANRTRALARSWGARDRARSDAST